jgi:hypothetical protein
MFYAFCYLFTNKQPHEVKGIIKKYSPRDAFDLYDSFLNKIEFYGAKNATIVTSAENVQILMSAGLIIHDQNTTKLWLKDFYGDVEVAASIYHGNNYANLVYRELPYEPKKA